MLLISAAVPSEATPILWTLNDVSFVGGGTASGSFVFDASGSVYSSVSVSTSGGTNFGNTYDSAAIFSGASFATFLRLDDGPDFIGDPGFLFSFSAPLTDAGGVVPLSLGGFTSEGTCLTAECGVLSVQNVASAGFVVGVPVPVPILWTLTGVTFDGGGTASGSFVFDSGLGVYSSVSVSTSGGTNFGNTYDSARVLSGAFSAMFLRLDDGPDFIGDPGFLFSFSAPLTDTGVVPLTLGGFTSEGTCIITAECGALSVQNVASAGSVVGVPAPATVPEPTQLPLVGACLAGLLWTRRRGSR